MAINLLASKPIIQAARAQVISDSPIERFRKLLADVPAAELSTFQDQVLEALTAAKGEA